MNLPSKTIQVILILVVLVVALTLLAAFSTCMFGCAPNTSAIRADSMNTACAKWKVDNSCNEDLYEEPLSEHQESGEPEPRNYSIKELCNLVGITVDKDCYLRCGCELE